MGNIQLKVAAVIEVFDRFLDRPVENGKVWMKCAPGQKMIRKDESCFLLLEPLVEQQEIIIESDIFEDCRFELPKRREGELIRKSIWLEPNEAYNFPLGTTFVTGKLGKEQTGITYHSGTRNYHLSLDYQKADASIRIYGVSGENRGAVYLLTDLDQKQIEFAQIADVGDEDQEFLLKEPLVHDYRRSETLVARYYELKGKKDGTFYFAIPECEAGLEASLYDRKAGLRALELQQGQVNQIKI